jgi:ATP-dependent Lon protease
MSDKVTSGELPHAALTMMIFTRWDKGLAHLIAATKHDFPDIAAQLQPLPADHDALRERVDWAVEQLFERKDRRAGEMAMAWLTLAADPRRPHTFWPVITQLAWLVAQVDDEMCKHFDLEDRLSIWWNAARGDYVDEKLSVFAMAEAQFVVDEDPVVEDDPPGVVVMPKARAGKLKPELSAGGWKEMFDAKLPLVVAKDVAVIRRTLLAEYPHAATAIDLLLRDLREGAPIRMKPFILCGPPGNGKTRLIRRLGDLLGVGCYRFDGGSSSDGVGYGGTPRGWGDSTPCVPARAIQQYQQANVICMIDELEKACASPRNGSLFTVLLAHLEVETASRFRDASLDCELDLSHVVHASTANSTEGLPAPLKDRYRLINVPAPRLADLPALAANVLRELSVESGEEGFVWPLASDELDVIAAAWKRAGFSIRKLQKIVAATLEARNEHAMRH